ncbi:MAG: ABC transporter family substrate-binding protein [Actinomycetes bacterium]
MASLALIAACGSSGGSSSTKTENLPDQGRLTTTTSNVNSVNSGSPKTGGRLDYTIEKDIQDWNLNTINGNTFDTGVVLNVIYPQVYIPNPDTSTLTLNTDLTPSVDQTSTNPQTIVYHINPNAVWNDGKPIDATDFEYAWRTQNGKDCPACQTASTTGYDQIKTLTASDNGKTVTVVFSTPYSDWKGLFGAGYGLLPAHLCGCGNMADKATLAKSFNTTLDKSAPKFSGGPYVISSFKSNTAVTLIPNPKWYGKQKPFLSQLVFHIITDATQEPTALRNKEVQGIYPQPQVDLVSQVKGIPSVRYQLDLGLTWEHFDLNLHNPALAQGKGDALRKALFTSLNVQQIIDKTVGQFDKDVKQLNNRMFMPQQQGYKDNVSEFGYGKGDIAAAKKLLTDAKYTGVGTKLVDPSGKAVPTLTMRYTVGNTIRKNECLLFKAAAAQLGVNINVQTTDDLGASLGHTAGKDYDIIVFAWVGAPFFSANRDIYVTPKNGAGGNNFGGYTNSTVDQALYASVGDLDSTKLAGDLNTADKQISSDAYTLPLYQKPTFLAYYNNIVNLRDNATNVGPSYNAGMWGFK